ncbi:MAG: DUF3592 domain-containing protein [Deltaproteobacteria bacterium]|jgi:hypothetical protein|nr:DUF3592 domain-containing protein [Deltaproteobacteria bacterium]
MPGPSVREVKVFFLVGLVSAAFGGFLLTLDHAWQAGEGRITAVEARRSAGLSYTVYVQYDYLVGETRYAADDAWCAPPQFVKRTSREHARKIASGIRVGDAIPIFYDPRSPEDSICFQAGGLL